MRGDYAVAEALAGGVPELIHRIGLPDHRAAGRIADRFQVAVCIVIALNRDARRVGDRANPADIVK